MESINKAASSLSQEMNKHAVLVALAANHSNLEAR